MVRRDGPTDCLESTAATQSAQKPRSIVQPPLTDADRSYYTDALRAEAQRPEQRLQIAYRTKSDTGQ
jgi:hypothetical protein